MKAHFQEHLAFYLNGKHSTAGLDGVEGLALRPALLAKYRTLALLRYDYPLVLAKQREGDGSGVHSLCGLCDALVADAPAGPEGDRLRHLAHRIEGEIRKQTASGAAGNLWSLWEWTERQLLNQENAPQREDLDRLRAALTIDGPVLECDAQLPWRLLQHCWRQDQERKADLMRSRIERLVFRLCEILRVDEENSETGLGAQRLQAAFSSTFASDFNFDALSTLLSTARPSARLPQARRQRLHRLLGILQSQRFFPIGGADQPSAYDFTFDSCSQALKAYGQRLPEMAELAKAMMVAELEVEGTYREQTHDAVFDAIGATDLEMGAVAQFPDYLIHLPERSLTASEGAKLIEMLTAGLPMKILLQTDDIAPPHKATDGYLASGVSARHWANMAIGIGGVFVLQAPASHLYRFRERIARGLGYGGPALFCVYSGAGGGRDVPPYLMAAAAMESRAFPAFVYDPGAGPDWASRCTVGDTPQPERDWPVYELSYEDGALQRTCVPTAFTLADFLALDARYASQLARVPPEQWNESMVPVADFIALEPQGLPDRVPYLLMADDQDALHRVLVSHPLIRQARRCREQWHTLRELGGICNSFAEQLLARERQAWEAKAQEEAAQQAPAVASPVVAAAPSEAAAGTAPAQGAAPAPARNPDEATIETIRCSSCNECTQINNRMFKYNENKQAFIADLTAGTYAQLVMAAERCQLAIIHPGKPTNPNEPGLEELLKRAEPFR